MVKARDEVYKYKNNSTQLHEAVIYPEKNEKRILISLL